MKGKTFRESSDGEAHTGLWIGVLERIVSYLLVIAGQAAIVALIFGGKSFIRVINKEADLPPAEYLIIGTLLSALMLLLALAQFGWLAPLLAR